MTVVRYSVSLVTGFLVLLSACGTSNHDAGSVNAAPVAFALVFEAIDTIILVEADSAPVGDITSFRITSSDQLIVADGQSGVIRLFDRQGSLLRSLGRAGPAPGEFAGLRAADANGRGEICAVQVHDSRLTCFLRNDTVITFALPGSAGLSIHSLGGEAFFAAVQTAPGAPQVFPVRSDGTIGSGLFPQDSAYTLNPYWNSMYGLVIAAGSSHLVTGTRLLFPVEIFDVDSGTRTRITQTPGTWRQAEVVDAGTFSGMAGRSELIRYLRSVSVNFDVFVLGDTLVGVVQGYYAPRETDSPPAFFRVYPASLALYDTGGSLVAETDLPGRPLYADSLLYMLTDTVSAEWRIVVYRPRRIE